MKILIGYKNKFVVNDLADDLTIARLRIAAGYIFGRSALSDSITLWPLTTIIITMVLTGLGTALISDDRSRLPGFITIWCLGLADNHVI